MLEELSVWALPQPVGLMAKNRRYCTGRQIITNINSTVTNTVSFTLRSQERLQNSLTVHTLNLELFDTTLDTVCFFLLTLHL